MISGFPHTISTFGSSLRCRGRAFTWHGTFLMNQIRRGTKCRGSPGTSLNCQSCTLLIMEPLTSNGCPPRIGLSSALRQGTIRDEDDWWYAPDTASVLHKVCHAALPSIDGSDHSSESSDQIYVMMSQLSPLLGTFGWLTQAKSLATGRRCTMGRV